MKVVIGVLIKDGLIFLNQRPLFREFPGTWESVGGKVEGSESFVEALIREYKEEVGLKVFVENPEGPMATLFFDRPNVQTMCTLIFYRVQLEEMAEGKEQVVVTNPKDSMGYGWFTWRELKSLELTLGNASIRELLIRLVKESENGE